MSKQPGPDRKDIYDDEKVFEHESYGMVGFSRIQGSTGPMFGSALPDQSTFIRLQVHRASRRHHLGRDWYSSSGSPILLELNLTANQFAELLTNMNVGNGVPCTLRYVDSNEMEPCPAEKLEAQQVRDDFENKTEQIAKNLDGTVKKISAILDEKKPISQAERKEIRQLLDLVVQDVRSNIPFWLEQFHTATGKIATSVKAEVEAFLMHAITSAGLKALSGERPPVTLPALVENNNVEDK